jgi:hypothetical protein
MNNIHKKIIIPIKSLITKYGEKLILSKLLLIPRGLLDPVKCKKNK